jgi:hypothetical protein
MHFTKSALKQKKVDPNGTNKMGQYYSTVRVPIKNYNTASIAKRIDKNMTSLTIPDHLTTTSLDDLLKPVLKNDTLEFNNEKIPNIFNYRYDNINISTGIAEKTKDFENEEQEMMLKLNNNNNDNTKIHMDLKTTDKHFNTFVRVLTGEIDIDELKDKYIDKDKEEDNKKQTIDIPLKILQLTKPIIENVYQEKYKDGIASGLGDFIRGSYFLMQFCDNNNIPYNINLLNHPISQFLEIYINKQPLIYNNINKFGLTNHNPHILDNHIITNIYDHSINDNFIQYLSDQQVFTQKLYVYTISYPTSKIDQNHKEYMRQILKPCFKVASAVDDLLLKLELVKKQFTIIHIRYGDDFLIKKHEEIKKSHLEMIQNILDKLDRSQKYLLISDNTIIKNIIQSKHPFIKTHFNEISHTGEGLQLETNKLQNTMIDFYLFSHATKIIAFSVYKHGTGFSKWSAETYNVPYCCLFLQ